MTVITAHIQEVNATMLSKKGELSILRISCSRKEREYIVKAPATLPRRPIYHYRSSESPCIFGRSWSTDWSINISNQSRTITKSSANGLLCGVCAEISPNDTPLEVSLDFRIRQIYAMCLIPSLDHGASFNVLFCNYIARKIGLNFREKRLGLIYPVRIEEK